MANSQGSVDEIEVMSEPEDGINVNRPQVICLDGDHRKSEKRIHLRPYASASSRIMKKCGKSNVETSEIPNKTNRYFQDLGNTLLTTRWRWILIGLCLANGIAYAIFAALWFLVAEINDDYRKTSANHTSTPCIANAHSFTSYLLLSIETLTTIGFGTIYPTDCHPNWLIITLEAITGVAIEGALVTAVFVKMSRPYNKDPVKMFSRKAVICMRDGVLSLMFRIRDIQGKHWAKTALKAVLIRRKISVEGEPLQNYFENLKLEKFGLLMWPQEIVHKITRESPLWDLSPDYLCRTKFEIMIILVGDSIVTGQPSQSQSSYTNREILWGHRYVPCTTYDKHLHSYIVDHDKFSEIIECDTPLCSARDLSGILEVASRPNLWDLETYSTISTPMSRRSENSSTSSFRYSSYRLKKGEMDGVPLERNISFHRQISGAPLLETINSVENLVDSREKLEEVDEKGKDEKNYLSTNL